MIYIPRCCLNANLNVIRILLLDDSGSMTTQDCKPQLAWIAHCKSKMHDCGLNNRMGAVFEAGKYFIPENLNIVFISL